MDWKKRLLFDNLAIPNNPTSAPQTIAQRLFQFVKRSAKTVAFNNVVENKRISEKSEERKKQDKHRELLDCTPLTSYLPVKCWYFIASQTVCSLGELCVEGHAKKVNKGTCTIYLKFQHNSFPISQQWLLDVPNVV